MPIRPSRREALGGIAAIAVGGLARRSSGRSHPRSTLFGRPPIVIAHRGASGYAPELSLPAFTLAHAMNPEMIETDVSLTKDGVLINLHDLTLDRTTDVAERFPGRSREDGKHYAIDFTLNEIHQLTVTGPADRFDRPMPSGGRIPTLAELLDLVAGLNRTTDRHVEVLVEVKDPDFHVAEGQPIDRPVLDLLAEHGIIRPGGGAVVQSFGHDYTRDLRLTHGTQLPLVWLIGKDDPETLDLDDVAAWADGIGPNRDRAERDEGRLIREAHERDLAVYCWTFKNERGASRRFVHDLKVDGLISDFPDVAANAIKA